MKKIRVLVTDDSALMRKLIPSLLERSEDIEVVDTAMDGIFALAKAAKYRPDVITMDLDMPRLNGLQAIRQITRDMAIPILVLSSQAGVDNTMTIQALEAGAIDFLTKPSQAFTAAMEAIAGDLAAKVRIVANGKPRSYFPLGAAPENFRPVLATDAPALPAVLKQGVVVIGASTGGPGALCQVLPAFPKDFPWPILVVQHMPASFTRLFADRLQHLCPLDVREAAQGDVIRPGRILIAPGDRHLRIRRNPVADTVELLDTPPLEGHRPSIDVLFESAAERFGAATVGVIMTGMGADGAEGLLKIHRAGGHTVAQDQETSVIYGMPKAAVKLGGVELVVSLDTIAETVVAAVRSQTSPSLQELTERSI